MCINMRSMWLCKKPYKAFGNFYIMTHQYNELCQYEKEYVFFGDNNAYIKKFSERRLIYVPCGKCYTCLAKRSKAWSFRLTTEYLKYDKNCILTLTYNDDNLPDEGLINYRDIQLFLKRLRKKYSDTKIRFCCSCEYGSNGTKRPHYHLLLFNFFPEDVDLRFPYHKSEQGTKLYKSKILSDMWSLGFVDVGTVDFRACRYVTQYVSKKIAHKNDEVYQYKNSKSRERMIVSVGTGKDWLMKNYKSVFNSCFCVLGGRKYPIPDYFKKTIKKIFPDIYNVYLENVKKRFEFFVYDFDYRRKQEAIEERYRRLFEMFHTKHPKKNLTSLVT